MSVPIAVVLVVGILAGVIDVWKYKVHNAITLPLLASGLIYHAATGGIAGFGHSLASALFGLSFLLIPYILGGMGGGDVKLMAGVGAWLGWPTTLYVVLASSIAAGVYSLVLLTLHGGFARACVNFKIVFYQIKAIGSHLGSEERVEQVVHNHDRRRRLVPFAAMMTIGVLAVLLWNQFSTS